MKLTALLIFAALIQVSASTLAQKINLHAKNAALITVLKTIHQQSGFNIVYTENLLKESKPVTADLQNIDLDDALAYIFNDQPLTYTIESETVIVKAKQLPGLLDKVEAYFTAIDVRGRVIGDDGQPLSGATVQVKDGSSSATTDANGMFLLRRIQPGTVLVISFIGYEKNEIAAKADLGMVKLKLSENKLDAVKIIAYGQTTERVSIGSSTTVSSKTISAQPVDNALLALEGQVAGLQITQTTGLPGGGLKILIQGQNSISFGNDPLYVIDGVPYISEYLPNLAGLILNPNGVGNGQPGNPLSLINPADIESISVLKDASATAIYGSRAANGAILITTKKGVPGKTRFNADLQDGWGEMDRTLPLMNTHQYLAMRYAALANDGIASPSPTDYDINGTWDTTRNTNWQKVLLGNTAHYLNYTASVSGGSANTQYLLSGTYHRQTTVFPADFSDQKGSAHFNVSNTSTDQKFHLTASASYLFDNNQLPGVDLTYTAMTLEPDAPALYTSTGAINWAPTPAGSSTWANPLAITVYHYDSKAYNLISSAALRYQILPGLEIKANVGFDNTQVNEVETLPLTYFEPEVRSFIQRSATYSNNNINAWSVEPQLTYQRTFGKHKLDFLAGSTFQQRHSNGYELSGSGYNSDLVLQDIHSAATVTALSSTISEYKYNALFGRLSYNYSDKYLLELSARRDGSSRFGPENEFHNFGSIGAGWVFSEEKPIRNALPFLSYGKLTATYGTVGNDQIPDYQFLNIYYPLTVPVPYEGVPALAPSSLSNPYIHWESTSKLDVGLNLGFFKDRILLNGTYFRNRTSDELLGYALPIITGFRSILENFPATVQNSGWEFTLDSRNINGRTFSWETRLNLTFPGNKLISFPGLATSAYATRFIIGKPVNIFKLFNYKGVDPTTGEYQFQDAHGNITSTPNFLTDNTALVNLNPRCYGGFDNTFRYKQFELDIMFHFSVQNGYNNYFGFGLPGYFGYNQPTTVLGAWSKPGDHASIQRYNSTASIDEQQSDATESNAAYSSSTFIRLKNLSFSWQIPDAWSKTAHLQSLRLLVRGENLLTFTGYKGLDPETASAMTLPPLRVLTVGLNVAL